MRREHRLTQAVFPPPPAQGICEAVQNTVLLLYATDEFEEQGSLGTVMGWEESCAGLGFIVGPSAGAVLYQLGGFEEGEIGNQPVRGKINLRGAGRFRPV